MKKYTMRMWSWKRFKTSWMGHGAWMGIAWGNMEDVCTRLKHSSQNIRCFGGDMVWGSSCLSIEMHVRSFTESWHVSVGGRFQGSCFVVCDFWSAETSARSPLKHDMFLCQFASRPLLLVHGNPHRATSKQVTYLQLVIEITSRHKTNAKC
jgi:hypothetical protein